ncbi:lipopolysaccharide biosynthesis protein [Bacteroides zoogleoformans]|uniref:lipopolysaccharide biosynthesis protein n=1 Tax=Bacteroides zoogleoformans TaxID=28119 RepID=UPI00248E15D4|nr:lipopolysaccharide biosynthesis protein [Bacteroides zoogleoformans]
MSVKSLATKGLVWNAIERFSSQGIQFILTIIIARILSPDDYGLVAMLGIFMAITQTIVDSGFSNALIQKRNRTEVDYSTMFYFNIVVSIFMYGLLFVSAPWIARFYNRSELINLVRILGLVLITNSLGVVQMTRLTISLDFKKLAIASLIGVIIGGSLGIWMAYHGYGAWTLVFQLLSGNLFWGMTLWLFTRWVPKRIFSWSSFRELFSFGSKLLFSSLLHSLYTHMYSLVVGKAFNASTLGYFNRSYTLGQFPVQNFSNIVHKVLYPIQCRYQDEREKFNYLFISCLRISGFVMFPLMIGFSVLAEPVILLLLKEKWLPAVSLFRIICLSMMWLPMLQANVSVLDAKGRSDHHLQAEFIKKILAIIILLFTLQFNIEIVCWGMLVYSLVDLSVIVAYSRRLTSVGYKEQIEILSPSLILALIMGGFVYGITFNIDSAACKLLVGVGVGMVFYILSAHFLKLQELKLLISFLKGIGMKDTDSST